MIIVYWIVAGALAGAIIALLAGRRTGMKPVPASLVGIAGSAAGGAGWQALLDTGARMSLIGALLVALLALALYGRIAGRELNLSDSDGLEEPENDTHMRAAG